MGFNHFFRDFVALLRIEPEAALTIQKEKLIRSVERIDLRFKNVMFLVNKYRKREGKQQMINVLKQQSLYKRGIVLYFSLLNKLNIVCI